MSNTHVTNMKYVIACQIIMDIKHSQRKNEKCVAVISIVIIFSSRNNSSISIDRYKHQ